MALYPSITDLKRAAETLPDGTHDGAGWTVTYSTYAMGQLAAIWGRGLHGVQAGAVARRRRPFPAGEPVPVVHRVPRGAQDVPWQGHGAARGHMGRGLHEVQAGAVARRRWRVPVHRVPRGAQDVPWEGDGLRADEVHCRERA